MTKWRRQETVAAILFLGPSLVGFSVFYLVPFAGGVVYSLLDSPVRGRFVGLANYAALLASRAFLTALRNTALFSALCLPLAVALSLVLALLLVGRSRHVRTFRLVFITPLVVPIASVALVWQLGLGRWGALNGMLVRLGMSPVDWMNTPWSRVALLALYLWKNLGYGMVLFLVGLQAIPGEYYEAAAMDGAGRWRRFRSITCVYLTPTAFFVLIISIVNSFKVFREAYLMAGAYPDERIYMLQHYMNNTFRSLDYQRLTSAAVLMAAAVYLIVLCLFGVERRIGQNIG